MQVEVCANSLRSAINAEKAGADRIELCAELGVGGITPSYGLLKSVKERISIPVHVLIRPRSGDFTYSDIEFDIMKKDIALCVDLGFDGIVSGILLEDFSLDVERTGQLINASKELKFTFHRAFDWVEDPYKTLEQLEALQVDFILTSGQQKSAVQGIDLLIELLQQESNCTIMPGGGIDIDNVRRFNESGFGAIHLSGTESIKTLVRLPKISMNSFSFIKDDEIGFTAIDKVQEIVNAVK